MVENYWLDLYNYIKISPKQYFYKDFNGIDLSNMELGTINKGKGIDILYSWLNKQMTEKSLRFIFSENLNIFILLESITLMELNSIDFIGNLVFIESPYDKFEEPEEKAFADSILKFVKEGFIEEVKIPRSGEGNYFYYIRKT